MSISIVIPAYNAEARISQCIESIIYYQHVDYELIIVNDGSTDRTGEICDRYARINDRIKVLHKLNGGVSVARNEGLKLCTKKFVTFIDSDDYLEPDSLPVIFDNMVNENRITLWVYDYYIVYNNRRIIKGIQPGIIGEEEFINGILRYNGIGSVWGKIFITEIAKQCSFSSMMKMGEDTKYVIDYLEKTKGFVSISPIILYNYVQNDNSVTHNHNIYKEYTVLSNIFINHYLNKTMSEERLMALSYYVGTNVFVKLQNGCFDFSAEEIRFIKQHLKYCSARFDFKYKLVIALFSISPKLAFELMRIVTFLKQNISCIIKLVNVR